MRPERRPNAPEQAASAAAAAKKRAQEPLFIDTVTASELRGPKATGLLGDVTDTKALRVVHRGHQIKVVVTESHYLALLNFWNLFEAEGEPLPLTTSAEELAAAEREDAVLDALEAQDRD